MSDGFLSAEAFQGLTTEADFQGQVVERAGLNGWRVFFIPDWVWRLIFALMRKGELRRRGRSWSRPGFPDLVMVRVRDGRGRLIFAELKAKGGHTHGDQDLWLADLRTVPGIEVYLWRPADQDDIERILA